MKITVMDWKEVKDTKLPKKQFPCFFWVQLKKFKKILMKLRKLFHLKDNFALEGGGLIECR